MNLAELWDIQVLVYVLITAGVVVLMLLLIAVLSRRQRLMASELESLRRDLRLLEEGVRTVNESLRAKSPKRDSVDDVIGSNPEPPEGGEPGKIGG
jgi:hypothetical protein